jgi:hypothetical protein
MKRTPQQTDVESAVAYIVLRKLMKNVRDTDAFKLGLIDQNYKIIRQPENEIEQGALNPLNMLIFTLKRALGPNISKLFQFLYLNNYDEDKYMDSLLVRGMIKNRSDIVKVMNDLYKK